MKYYYILPLILGMAACSRDYGDSIGRAQQNVATENLADCSHYLSEIKPSDTSNGIVTLKQITNHDLDNKKYFLCSQGQCQPVELTSDKVTVDLPLNGLDLASSGELALVIDGVYNSVSKICSYLAWKEDSESDVGGAEIQDDHNSDIIEDGNSDINNGDTNSDIIDDANSDINSDDTNSDIIDDANSDNQEDTNSDIIIPTPHLTADSMAAAVIAGLWPAGEVIVYQDGTTMISKKEKPVSPQDWECQ